MKTLKNFGILALVMLVAILMTMTFAYKQSTIGAYAELEREHDRRVDLERQLNIVSHKGNVVQGIKQIGGETVITYGEYQGYPLQLVIGTDKRVTLQVVSPVDDYSMGIGDDHVVDFLRKEVERLAKIIVPNQLGTSGVKFVFADGVPVWGPYHQMSQGNQASCLLFAEKTTFNDGTVTAHGSDKKDPYWPYELTAK